MKIILMIVFCLSLSNILKATDLSDTTLYIHSLKVFFWDSETKVGKKIYRELKEIGEGLYYSKPNVFDIYLKVNGNKTGRVEILIETLVEPLQALDNSTNQHKLTSKSWVPYRILHSSNTKNTSKETWLRDIFYPTIGDSYSNLYSILGFRVIAYFFDENGVVIEKKYRVFLTGC